MSTLYVGEQRRFDCLHITLATPQTPLSFIILAFKKPHTRSDTSQHKAPFVSDQEKLIFRKVWKEKSPTPCANTPSVFEASSSSSQPIVTHYSGFTPKTLTYPAFNLATPTTMFSAQVPQANLNPTLLIQMVVPGFPLNKYAPLDLPQLLSVMPQDYLNLLPRFNGEDENTEQRHNEAFCSFAENLNVEQLDVVLRHFVQSLDGEARKWFKALPNASITTWEELENSFTQKWGEKRNHEYLLT